MKLEAGLRDKTRGSNGRLRREGKLPAVVYGRNVKTQPLVLDAHEFDRVLARAGHTQLVDLAVEGAKTPRKVLIKEVQISPRRFTPVHVDFHAVSMREKLQVEVPVVLHGEPEPVRVGDGDVLHIHHNLRVESLPADLPERIDIDISGLAEIDAGVRVSEIKPPPGVTILADPEELIVKITVRRDMAAELEAEEAAEGEAAIEGAPEAEEEGGEASAAGEDVAKAEAAEAAEQAEDSAES